METKPFNKQQYFGEQLNALNESIVKVEQELQALYALKSAFEHELTIIESRSVDADVNS